MAAAFAFGSPVNGVHPAHSVAGDGVENSRVCSIFPGKLPLEETAMEKTNEETSDPAGH